MLRSELNVPDTRSRSRQPSRTAARSVPFSHRFGLVEIAAADWKRRLPPGFAAVSPRGVPIAMVSTISTGDVPITVASAMPPDLLCTLEVWVRRLAGFSDGCRRTRTSLALATFFLIISQLAAFADDTTDPTWSNNLPEGNQCLSKLITAISGKPNSEKADELLRGVDKVSFADDLFTFHREDDQELLIGAGTTVGDRMLKGLEKAKTDTDKYSGNLSEVLNGFKAVQVTGNHVEIIRDGEQDVNIQVTAGVKKLPFRLKEVRLGRLSMDLDESKGFPAVKNLTGLEVIVKVGIDFHIVLKEFWRTRNERGDTTVTFGIVNPLPRAVRMALGLKEITYVSHTLRKKQERVSVNSAGFKSSKKVAAFGQTLRPLIISNKNRIPATSSKV